MLKEGVGRQIGKDRMYVKVTRGGSMSGDLLMEARTPIYSGSATIPYALGYDNDVPGALGIELGRQMELSRKTLEGQHQCPPVGHHHGYTENVGEAEQSPPLISWTEVHVEAMEAHSWVGYDEKAGHEWGHESLGNWWQDEEADDEHKGFMNLRYAWWYDSDEGKTVCVITTRNIFIVGENGKTIDRVR